MFANKVIGQRIIDLIAIIFNDVSFLNVDIIEDNVEALSNNSILIEHRAMPKDVYDYILDNFGYIYASLIYSKHYRNHIYKNVLAAKNYEECMPDKNLDECVIFDTSSSDLHLIDDIMLRIQKSIHNMLEYSDLIDLQAKSLSGEDMEQIGIIVCNFAYFIKVYCVDDFCVEYLTHTIDYIKSCLECELYMITHDDNE